MAMRLGKIGTRTLAGALVVTGPTAAACGSSGPTYDQWAETDGAAGRINLEQVQNEFKLAKSPTDFETRVNKIYEGDGLVLIRAKQEAGGLSLEGWEDLNGNNEIDDATDDQLFGILERDKQHEMRGYGANSYYRSGFGAGDFLFTYMLISAISPRGYYYSTPRGYAGTTLRSQRNHYRTTSGYNRQVGRNTSYFNRQKSFAGSRYTDAGRNLSTSRRSYQSTQRSTGAYKRSGSGVRSSWGSSRSSGGSFRGGGGGQSILGRRRG